MSSSGRSDDGRAHAQRQALRLQASRRGNREDAGAVPYSAAAGADRPDEGTLRRSTRGARYRSTRIPLANGARAEDARVGGRESETGRERAEAESAARHRERRAGEQDPEARQGTVRHGAFPTPARRPRNLVAGGRRRRDHAQLALVLSASASRPAIARGRDRSSPRCPTFQRSGSPPGSRRPNAAACSLVSA